MRSLEASQPLVLAHDLAIAIAGYWLLNQHKAASAPQSRGHWQS